MFKVVQHIPAFVSGFEPKEIKVSSKEELEKVEWIKSWMDDKDFDHLCWSRGDILMVQMKGSHWVVGFCENVADLGYPKWKG